MSISVLEINDVGLALARGPEVVAVQPGYVLREAGHIVIGDAAVRQARANPHAVSHRYWDTLDQETLPSEGHWRETPAELAFLQLQDLWAAHGAGSEGLMLVVPPLFSHTQLGLILGMCRKAKINVLSLVDSAIAALDYAPAAPQIIVVDLTLHRVVATRIVVDSELRRAATAEIDQFGLADYRRKWAAAIGDVCVRSTRYDPMHSAAAEQSLHDDLPALLDALSTADSAVLPIDISGERRNVTVPRSALVQSCAALNGQIDGLINGLIQTTLGQAEIVLTHRVAQCPGVVAALGAAHGGATVLPTHAAVLGVSRDVTVFAQTDAGAVGLITTRPRGRADAATTLPRVATQNVPPSHILVDNRVYVLSSTPFVVGTATRVGSWGYRAVGAVKGISRRHCSIVREGERTLVRDHSTYGTFVNGRRVNEEMPVSDGDVVRVGNPGVELRLVREAAPDGQA